MELNYSIIIWQIINILIIILLIVSIIRIINVNSGIKEKLFWLIISIVIPILGPIMCLRKFKS